MVRNARYPNTFRTWARQPGNHYVRGIGLRFVEGDLRYDGRGRGNHKEKEKTSRGKKFELMGMCFSRKG